MSILLTFLEREALLPLVMFETRVRCLSGCEVPLLHIVLYANHPWGNVLVGHRRKTYKCSLVNRLRVPGCCARVDYELGWPPGGPTAPSRILGLFFSSLMKPRLGIVSP